jgi:hypothetical protein
MFASVTLPLIVLLVALPGLPKIPGLPGFGIKDIKKLREGPAPPLDSLPPAWKPASRLALENRLVLARLPVLGPGRGGLKLKEDPRKLRVRFDPDSGAVRYVAEVGEFTVGEARRVPLAEFTRELTRRNFARLWEERARQGLQSTPAQAAAAPRLGGLTFELPSPLPPRFRGLLGPGNPSLTVSGSENIRLSGQSSWSNQQFGLLGQRRSLFPSLDMQQDLDIRLEGRLSDRVGVNLLQNSANQVPLANRVAINYKGDEDDLVQALDLGNTNLTLPGTQYVSYSGRNEGLFGMKATSRLGPLDFTVLASKQEGRSERASYAGGSSPQSQILGDKDYVKGVYFFLYDPNLPAQDIDESSMRLFLDEGINVNVTNMVRGRAFVDPITAVVYPPGAGQPDSTPAVHGTFRLLTPGADQDYEILSDVYGPLYKVIRLKSALTGDNQRLAVVYRYRQVGAGGVAFGDSIRVGGQSELGEDGVPALRMKLIRPPTGAEFMDRNLDGFVDAPSDTNPFPAARELELRNFYQLAGQRIDPRTFELAIMQGDEQPPRTTVSVPRPPPPPPTQSTVVPYIEVLGLDNFDETSGFVNFDAKGHDGRVDGTAPSSNFRAFVDFDRGTIFFPDLRPFAPRLAPDGTGRPFERAISRLLARRDSLVGPPPAPGENPVPNAANPAIYDKRTLLSSDRTYSIEVRFTAARAGNEISLGRTNIIEGSDVVTINGQPLQRDRDYRIDYDLGRVTLIRQLGPADQLNIDYGYAPLFQQAGRTLIGNAFRWEGTERSFGGAFLYESKGAQDLRPRLGEEPSRVLIGDLNTEWRFRPAWLTRVVDRLPGLRTAAPSELHVQAEVGASFPNPNTRNEVFIDDMEGVRDAVGLSMGPERWRWTSIPLRADGMRVDDPSAPSSQRNAEIHWYSPLNVVKERDLKPSLTDAQGAQNSRQVLAISLPRRPTSLADPGQRLWAGLTYVLDPVGIDLSRSQFIEIWVNDFRDHHNGIPVPRVRGRNVKLHIDLGAVSEDQQRAPNIPPNNIMDSEDQPPRDNQLVVTDEKNEDTGYDGRLNAVESRDTIPDLTTVTPADPQGDDFAPPDNRFKDWDPRKWRVTNGTEGNKNVFPLPDTEDLNLNNALDVQQSYFEYTIDLGDTAQRYLITDVHRSFGAYANNGEPIPADNGWRRYRIPIADSLRIRIGAPDLTLARHVRLWVEDVLETDPSPISADDGRPFLAIGGLEIVGSRWLVADLDSASLRAGTTITLNSVNTVDHADVYVPPFDPGRTRSGSQELTRREQSLALEFAGLEGRDTLEVYKTFSLDEDYSRYGKLNFYAAAFGIPGYDEVADSLDYFLRFASDEKGTSYYEYRARLPRSSTPGAIHWRQIALTLNDLSNLKLRPDFPATGAVLYRAPGQEPGEEYVIKGRPSFTRLRRISFGIINASGKPFPTGQLWLNELRATDVAKDAGRAQRVSVVGQVANLLNYNLLWNGRDADFQSVGEARGSGNSSGSFGFQSQVHLHRFFEGTRILLPVNVSYQRNQSAPRFTAGDDVVRGGALAEASDTRVETRSFSVNYSRTWSDRSHPVLRHTMGGITAGLNRIQTDSRNPLTTDGSRSTSAHVNYSLTPRQLLRVPIPATRIALFPLPERFYWNYAVHTSENRSFERRPDSSGAFVQRYDTQGRVATIDFGADTRPLDFLRHGFAARRNLMLPEPLLERVGFVNLGRVVNWSQTMDARVPLPQRHGPWLRPNLSWNSRYTQDNGLHLSPDLSQKVVTNGQAIALTWDLPFDRLTNPTGPGPARADTAARPRAAGWRRWLSRLGPASVNGAFSTSSSHSRVSGMPRLAYIFGLAQDPGFGDDSTGRVQRRFGNSSNATEDWRAGGQTTLNLGLGATLLTRADYATTFNVANRVTQRTNRIRFPELDLNYGKVAELIGLSRIFVNPRLETRYNRSQIVSFANSAEATGISTSSEWRPLLKFSGDLKNGTRCQVAVERRVTQSENRQLGNSLTTDRNTNVNLGVNRSYSKGQKVSVLGKETTVRSNINLGLSAAYELQDGETVQQGQSSYETKRDRLSVNAQGGYSFSTNVTGNLELGFGQNRDLVRDVITRTVRVELRAQFTF